MTEYNIKLALVLGAMLAVLHFIGHNFFSYDVNLVTLLTFILFPVLVFVYEQLN